MGRNVKAGAGAALLAAVGAGVLGRGLLRRMPPVELRGQVVLVTGGSRGLGFLLAREFAREGCRIALCARNELEMDKARRELERDGADVMALRCDVADQVQVERTVEDVTRRFGRVDVLINNAGIIQVGPIQTMDLRDFENAMAVMFYGGLYATLAVLPQMLRRKGGTIVNITSIGGKVSVPHLLPYNCAKFATVGLSEGLCAELAREGIRVVTIVPGLMRTGSPMNALFKGKQAEEFTWFTLGDSLPFISMDAERAARQIVDATKRGGPERILSLPANILARFHCLFPGATIDLLSLANRLLLPSAEGGTRETVRGMEADSKVGMPFFKTLTAWTRSAARRFNQFAGQ